ncbi:MAG: hypothetical protein PWR21_712 [Methanoculleus sp.]|nr:hypothetical protein [Methanoculleus sp.]MDK2989017.1 hypothetical protein [Methanoculleus sp.]
MNGEHTLEDHTEALEELGVRMIEQKAMDVAGQCTIYIRAHPDMSLSDIRQSPEFQQREIRQHQCRFLPPGILCVSLQTFPCFWYYEMYPSC